MAKFNAESLKKKYNGFIDGGCDIDIDGFQLIENFKVSRLVVQLTALYEASFAQFVIFDGFERDGEGFKMSQKLSSKLKIGKKVTVKIGYGKNFSDVFIGYIDSVRTDYQHRSGFLITVTCLDGKGMMMNNCRSEIKTNLKKYSEAVKKTIGLYSDFISSSKITATNEVELPFSQLNESDYDFVVRLAKKVNYSFYINLGKAYFVPFGSERTELLEVSPAFDLHLFSMETSLRKRVSKVVVVNNDEKDEKKQIKSEVSTVDVLESGSSSSAAANKAITGDMVKTIVEPSATTGEIAKTIAQAEINRLSYSSVEGVLEIDGVPDLQPGFFLALTGFGEAFEKSYYIKKIIHRLQGESFTTTIELGGNAI